MKCEGEGTGWGTIEDVVLRVLLLVAPDRTADGDRLEQAIHPRHQVTRLGGKAGLTAAMTAAKAAHEIQPHLVHACGMDGFAKTAGTVAAGLSVPYVVSLSMDEILAHPRRAKGLTKRADAVILDDTGPSGVLRDLGVERDLYVIGTPNDESARPYILGAHEIVYGRAVGAKEVPLDDAAPFDARAVDHDGVELVQIGDPTKRGS